MPLFLRKVRQYNSTYPNLHDKDALDAQCCIVISEDYKGEIKEIKQAMQALKTAHMKVHQIVEMRTNFYSKMTNNILNEGSKHDE